MEPWYLRIGTRRRSIADYNRRVRRIGLFVLTLLVFGATGCRHPVHEVSKHGLKIDILIADGAESQWIRSAGDFGPTLGEEFGADVRVSQVYTDGERRAGLRRAAERGAKLVVGVGRGFETPIQVVASAHPATAFVCDRGPIAKSNVARCEFLLTGAAYLGGVVAGVLGGPAVGLIESRSPVDPDPIRAGFERGFRRRQPRGRIDVVSGAGDLQELADRGVTIALSRDPHPHAGLVACAEVVGLRLVTIGRPRSVEPNPTIAASIDIDVVEAIRRITADVVDDTFVGKVYAFDVGSGVVDLTVEDSESDDPALSEALGRARDAVTAGVVDIEALGL